jgi:hypothetical protein
MNRKNIDNIRFVDLDEFVVLQIVRIEFADESRTLKDGFRVDGLTKNGLTIESLFVDRQSGKPDLCTKFIMDNWSSKK